MRSAVEHKETLIRGMLECLAVALVFMCGAFVWAFGIYGIVAFLKGHS